ncbi:hypothetical protein FJY93_04160 [Candidatus Kaiserbacteria bacterium]|nr:hypothetical protein [Candidatus Kaiserbacteria bacterium]
MQLHIPSPVEAGAIVIDDARDLKYLPAQLPAREIPDSVMMCSPDFFGVEYDINPHMTGNQGKINKARAREQWEILKAIIEQLVPVVECPAAPGLPDMVFMANAGLTFKRGNEKICILSNMLEERKGELEYFESFLHGQGYQTIASPVPFEGAGDALLHPEQEALWAGYGQRSVQESHEFVSRTLRVPVFSLELVDPRFYHLDTCFFPITKDKVKYFPGAFTERGRRLIEAQFPCRIEIGERDAMHFGCNGLSIRNHLIVPRIGLGLRTKLCEKGLRVWMSNMSEFMLAGGAVRCLTLDHYTKKLPQMM